MAKPIIKNKSDISDYEVKRERMQSMNFAKLQELLQRNVNKTSSHTFVQYTKDLLKTYILSPEANQETLRDISRFLERNSMLYKKLIMYYASMPLYYYNLTQINDMTSNINNSTSMKDYEKVLKRFSKFDIKNEGYCAIYQAIRDGACIEFCNDTGDGIFMQELDLKYCRIYGKTKEGQWVVYYDASFFDKGNNSDFITEGPGCWDDVFCDGYSEYKKDTTNKRWFRLPPEKTLCILANSRDQFYMPLPYFLALFCPLLDLLDLQEILQSKNELENYKLIISKIPLLSSDNVDDFAISLELAEQFNSLMEQAVPDLVGSIYSPMDIDTVSFESNTSDDTNALAESIQNLFQNAGASQLVVSGGTSTNSVGLNHAIRNDMSTAWFFVNQYESWLNYFIYNNISKNYELEIHRITWYNEEEYIQKKKDEATLGGSALDYLTACGDTPYRAFQKLRFENAIGIKDIMIPLMSSYNTSSDTVSSAGGRPESSEDDLTEEGAATRDSDKNAGTKANS